MVPRLLTVSAALLASVAAAGAATRSGSWTVGALLLAVATTAALRPPVALMIVAALAPLGSAIAVLGGPATEPLLLSLLAGWLTGRAVRREPWDSTAVLLAGLFALVVLISLLTQCVLAYQLMGPDRPVFPNAVLRWLAMPGRPQDSPIRPEVTWALRLLGGLGLFVMAVEVGRRSLETVHRALLMLTLGVTGVAVLSVSRFVEIVLRHGGDLLATALAFHRFVRVSSTIGDVNAAGAMFALVLPAAAAQCLAPRRRLAGVVALGACGAGLWLTGSRSAMVGGAAGLVAYLALVAWRRWTPTRVAVAGGLACVALAALLVWYPRDAAHATATDAWLIRKYLATASIEMARSAPLSGVGIGRFRKESPRFAPAALHRYYAAENAHNQMLQLLGELGLPGLGCFLALVACSVVPGWRHLGDRASESLRAPLVLGLSGFLFCSLLQHPLLAPEVAAVFWIALGLARSSVVAAAAPRRITRLVVTPSIVLIVLLLVTMPGRITATRNALDLEGVGVDLSAWRRTDDAMRFRRARGACAIFVDGRQGRVRLPLRIVGTRAPAEIDVSLDGQPAGRVSLASDEWTEYSFLIPAPGAGSPRFRRLDFRWTPATAAGRLDVGRESYSHHGDGAAPR